MYDAVEVTSTLDEDVGQVELYLVASYLLQGGIVVATWAMQP